MNERGVSVEGEEDREENVDLGDESEVIVVVWSAEDGGDDSVGSNDDVVSVVPGRSSLGCGNCAVERAVEDEPSGKVAVSVGAVFIVSAIVENWFSSVVAVSAGSSPMIWPFWHCSTISY